MKTLRTMLAIATVGLLTAGYAASQYAVFTQNTADYAARVDSAAVSRLALVLLIAIVALGFAKEPGSDEADDA